MEKLPEEILLKIFEELQVDSLRKITRVCQRWLTIIQNAPNIFKQLKLSLYFTDSNVTIIDELPGGPNVNLKICGLTNENFMKIPEFISADVMQSVRRLKLVNCKLRRYSSFKIVMEYFLLATHVTFECCTVETAFDVNGVQDVGPETHQNDFIIENREVDSRTFKEEDENIVAMSLFVTHLEIIYSDSYLGCLFTVSPLKYLCHGGFGDPRVIFMMLWSCPDIKELHVFEYSKNFVNFIRKFDEDKESPSINNRLEKLTVDHMYDHYLAFEEPQMTYRKVKRLEPLAMVSFLQTQRESLKELTVMNCPSNGDLVLMSSILRVQKIELGITNLQEIEGVINFENTLKRETPLKEIKLHGHVKRLRTLRAFVSQFINLSHVSFINSDILYISPRELSTTADPKIDYIIHNRRNFFNKIPIREVGIFKNDVTDEQENRRVRKIKTKIWRRLKNIKRMEIKNAKAYLEVFEF